jgi:hypothetical protein
LINPFKALCFATLEKLLPCRSVERWHFLRVTGSKGVDVQTPATRVASINIQLGGLAPAPNVHKHSLNALLMEFMVLSKADQIGQQSGLIDGGSCIGNANGAPIGLTRDQAVAL